MIKVNHEEIGGGSYASYFKLNEEVGVKVIDGGYHTEREVKFSQEWKDAKKEARLLTGAYASGVVPYCYGAKIIKRHRRWYAAIVMQHLGDVHIFQVKKLDKMSNYDKLHDALDKIGYSHCDLHGSNIMVYRGKLYAVDFSPDFITVKK